MDEAVKREEKKGGNGEKGKLKEERRERRYKETKAKRDINKKKIQDKGKVTKKEGEKQEIREENINS
jgi:hypothetical protein